MENKKQSILIVDDEVDIIEFLSYNLEKEGFKVASANDGEEGLAMIKKIRPDLVILDIMMPKLDGMEVCRQLRQDKENQGLIIVFLTARGEDYSQIAGFDLGADDYITKPIRPKVFVSRIKALLRRNSRPENEKSVSKITTFGELEIDREAFIVRKSDIKIQLAKKEFELLELLASKPGKVFERTEIYDKVWGADVIVGGRTIDVHIRKLREKIGDAYIKTIKGIGYKFEF